MYDTTKQENPSMYYGRKNKCTFVAEYFSDFLSIVLFLK